jgi:predicted Zn-dependent peptidase
MSLSSFACLSSPSPLPLSPTNRYLLPNGMVLLITELPQHPLISLDLFVHSGSVRDPLPGTSHFLEHLVFAQRTQSSHAHQSSFQDLGGIASASTWYDYSHYSQTLSSESLIPALEGLFPKDPQALIHNTSHFLKEKKIFHLELKQRHDQPELAFIETLLAETLQDTAYHSPHAGMFEGISQLQEHQVNSFYQEWYQPHQMILSASGDLSFEKLQPLLQNYLPAHSSSLLPPKKAPPPPLPRHRPGFRYHLESHPDFSLGLGLLLPGYCHPDRFPLKIAERYISAFLNEYLLNDFRHETRVDVRSYYMESAGVLTIRASGGSPLWVSKELFQGLKALRKKNTFSQESLEQIQRILSLEHLLQQEDIQEVTFRVGEAELFGDYRHFTSFQEQLFAVQVADIERVLKAYLSSNNISLRIKAPSPDLPALQELLEALEKKHRSWRSPRPPPC